mmetsp:Transcript_1073/g.2509  ORF Transcript_1073/g.2509 Transcript_1073/m.2509 type:complete len:220 (-) Transcript_1073:217-876(-)
MSTVAPVCPMSVSMSHSNCCHLSGVIRLNNPGINAKNSAPSPDTNRSMIDFASPIAPASPVKRMPLPSSPFETFAVRPVWSCSCRNALSLMTWFTMLLGTSTVNVSTVIKSSSASSMFSFAALAFSWSPSLLQIRAERVSKSRVMQCSASNSPFLLARWPIQIGSIFFMRTAPSSTARTSLGSSPVSTPMMASLHFAICSLVPSSFTFRIPGSSPSCFR